MATTCPDTDPNTDIFETAYWTQIQPLQLRVLIFVCPDIYVRNVLDFSIWLFLHARNKTKGAETHTKSQMEPDEKVKRVKLLQKREDSLLEPLPWRPFFQTICHEDFTLKKK